MQSGQDGAGERWQMLLRDADVSVRTARAERSVRRRLRRCRVPFRQQKGRQKQQVLLRINRRRKIPRGNRRGGFRYLLQRTDQRSVAVFRRRASVTERTPNACLSDFRFRLCKMSADTLRVDEKRPKMFAQTLPSFRFSLLALS